MNDGHYGVPDWFVGAVDIHVHSSPSVFPRIANDVEVARLAGRAGMRGVVIKAHEGSTVARAQIAETTLMNSSPSGAFPEAIGSPATATIAPETQTASRDVSVRGGVVLNRYVGGINPHAVEMALALSGERACIVWMPTVHAGNHMAHYGQAGYTEQQTSYAARSVTPLSVLDSQGALLPEVGEILELLAGHPRAILSNGHLSADETAALFREASRRKVERLIVSHPELHLTSYSLDFQLEMTRLGAMIERCYLPHLPRWGGFPPDRTAAEIRQLGPERCLLSTDLGQADSPPPAEGLQRFCRDLLACGLSKAELKLMVQHNPAELLGLA